MAIAIDGSSPIRFTGTPANNVDITSASFTPPANSVLVVCVSADTNGSTDNITISVSGSSLTWVNRVEHDPGDSGGMGGHASIWTPADGSTVPASAQTVSVRRTAGNGSTGRISVKIYVVTGADTADPTGATGENHSTTNNITPNAYTSTVDNSRGFGCATDWNQLGTPTSSDTEDGADYSGAISVVSLHKAADTATSGSTVTMNFDAGGTGNAEWNWVALEILPGAGGTPVSSDVTTSAAISRTEQSDVTTTAAISRSEQIEVTTSAAVSTTGATDVTTSAALSRTEQSDVTTTAATTRVEQSEVTTSAAASRTEQADVTTSGALSRTEQSEVTTDASITVAGAASAEVATSAATSRTEQGEVTTTAAASRSEQSEVTTTGALSRTEQGEVATDASITVAGAVSTEVTTTAVTSRVEQADVTTDAALSQSVEISVTTSAAASRTEQLDVTTSSALSRSEQGNVTTTAHISVEGQAETEVETSAAIGPPASILIDDRTLSASWIDNRTLQGRWIDSQSLRSTWIDSRII